MGQLPAMLEMFEALGIGLGVAVFVIFILLTAYFQSPSMALISVGAVPGVLAGIATMLYTTNTSLNIESFMGSIMCLGVSVSNSVMLVTFMNEYWKGGSPSVEAAVKGAGDRLRPILMTACAMTVGMVPMALALERGSQMQAPLGRAVIGGLLMSTLATLLVVPSIFALIMGRRKAASPSIYPDDPESRYYDPNVFVDAEHGGRGQHGQEQAASAVVKTTVPSRSHAAEIAHEEDALAFLRRILDEARAQRRDMVTHYTVDDLRVALGFAKPDSVVEDQSPDLLDGPDSPDHNDLHGGQ
jgi:predicted RND superfamily exporter protein